MVDEILKSSDLFSLKDKTALITGGSSGIGLMLARGMLVNGARVIISSRKKKNCDQAIAALLPYGDVTAVVCDVTNASQRSELVNAVAERFSDLDVLINNAGANWGARFEDYPDAGFAKVLDTNLNSVFSLTRDLVPALKRNLKDEEPSRIINIGSMDGIHVPIVQRTSTVAYSASKAALHHMTKVLAVELGPHGITVNAVAPGFFASKMTDYVFEHYRKDIEDDCPLGRVGRSEEIVGVVTYLASRAGAYTNGTVIPVDGGTSVSKGKREWM
jgi:NAD(P)-dependent dehydrogenase (short-subunit alcohol dehydrogenase family)